MQHRIFKQYRDYKFDYTIITNGQYVSVRFIKNSKLTKQEISDIWGKLPQTTNEENDAIAFGEALQNKIFEINK